MILKRLFNLKNNYKCKAIYNMLIITIIMIITINFTGCNAKNKEANSSTMNEIIEEIKKSQHGAFTELAYVSKDRVIFYGNIGLIVYDIRNQKIHRAINLESINMNHIQGSVVTAFRVKEDGNQILMFNDENTDSYIYDIENDKFEKTRLKDFPSSYKGISYSKGDQFRKYEDMYNITNYATIDKSNICCLLQPKKDEGLKGISHMKILILNKDTNKEEIYTVFN